MSALRSLAACGLAAAWLASAAAAAAPAMTPCAAVNGEPATLEVRITGFKSAKGNITVTLYPDDAKRFLAKGGKLARQRVAISLPVTQVCFALPGAGHYAVAVYHDADNDSDFDRTLLGLPAEGFGFSNNPETKIGLPAFKETRVAAAAGNTLTAIQLRY